MHQLKDPVRPLLVVIGILGLLHHADHVLRADHSGWPFQPDVTPFTWSLLIYPMLLADYLIRTKPWIRVGLLSAGLAFLFLVHVTVETPMDLFNTWQAGISTTDDNPGVPNLLHLASPGMGVAANVILGLLCAALMATLATALRQAVAGSRLAPKSSLVGPQEEG
jgi:hypothetical protein